MRNRLSTCRGKRRFATAADALMAAKAAPFPQRPYRCERCRLHHLTSRLKGKRIPRPVA